MKPINQTLTFLTIMFIVSILISSTGLLLLIYKTDYTMIYDIFIAFIYCGIFITGFIYIINIGHELYNELDYKAGYDINIEQIKEELESKTKDILSIKNKINDIQIKLIKNETNKS